MFGTGSEVIETLGLIDTVTLDKTGYIPLLIFFWLHFLQELLPKALFLFLIGISSILSLITNYKFVFTSFRFRTDKEDDEEADEQQYDPLRLAAALEDKSSHPLASAIVSSKYKNKFFDFYNFLFKSFAVVLLR